MEKHEITFTEVIIGNDSAFLTFLDSSFFWSSESLGFDFDSFSSLESFWRGFEVRFREPTGFDKYFDFFLASEKN